MSRLPERAPEPARLPLWKRVLFAITPLCASLLLLESCAALLGFEADRSGDPFVGFSSRSRLYEPVPDAAPETTSSKETPCFERLASALTSSHSNSIPQLQYKPMAD